MSNQQFDEVISLARDMHLDLNACPTCRSRKVEIAPGVWVWPDSMYRYYNMQVDEVQEIPCECEWQDTLRRHYLLAAIPMHYWTLGFAEYFGDPHALTETRSYLDNWVDRKWQGMGLQFYSPRLGTGKTMLATLIAKELIQRGERVFFIPFRDTVRLYQASDGEDRIKRLRTTTILVLDEVTMGMSDAQTSFYATELEDLIRFRTSGNAVTIVTTNMTPEMLEREYPRTFSLFAAKQQKIHVVGHDARTSGKLDLLRQEMEANNETRPII